jgi:hypothetical protein
MQRFGFLERRSKREGRLDCRGPLRGPRNDELEGRFAWQDIPSTFNYTRARLFIVYHCEQSGRLFMLHFSHFSEIPKVLPEDAVKGGNGRGTCA